MPHRSSFGDDHRYGREPEARFDRGRDRSREGRSWDDAGGYGSRSRYAQDDFGQHRERNDAYGESGYRSGGYSEDFSRRPSAASRDHAGYEQARFDQRSQSGGGGWYGGRQSANFGRDYGQGGHGGFGSGGYDGATQTGGSAGQSGSQHYGSHSDYGYNPSGAASREAGRHDYEPDYLHWREAQMRDLDRDYHEWRTERRQKFSREFDDWRNQRRAQAGQQGSTLSQAGGGYDGDQLQSNPQVTKVTGGDDDKKKN